MGLSFKRVKKIVEQFAKEYMFQGPWSDYINGCGISKVGIKDADASENEKEDLCIVVSLCKQPPSNLTLPTKYKGVKVYAEVTGEFKAY